MASKTLKQFVAALRAGDPDAARELQGFCRCSAVAIGRAVTHRYDVKEVPERLASHLICWFHAFLVSLPENRLDILESSGERCEGETWKRTLKALFLVAAFRHFLYGPAVLLKTRKASLLSTSKHGGVPAEDNIAFTLSGQQVATQWLRMPLDVVSGDLADHATVGDALWIVVADATGHGWLAHAVITGVACLWKALLEQAPTNSPRSLCELLDRQLEACLPESMFVEAILARFDSERTLSASPAGFCRIVIRRRGESGVEIAKLGNLYLGMGLPHRDEETISFDVGDEILLASDGIHEQAVGDGILDELLVDQLVQMGQSVRLYDALVGIIRDALANEEQEDDITAVTIQYIEGFDV